MQKNSQGGASKVTIKTGKVILLGPCLVGVLLVGIPAQAGAQSAPGFVWATNSATTDTTLGSAIDSQGHFRLVSKSVDLFLKTYDVDGRLLQSAVGSNQGASFLSAVVDPAGNTFVTGGFAKQAKLGNIQLTDSGTYTMCVAKYSPAGAALWAKCSQGGYGVTGYGISVDPSGNTYVTGEYTGTPGNPAKFGTTALTNGVTGYPDAFVAKYDASGKVQWAKRFGDGGVTRTWTIAADKSNNVYVAGVYSDPGIAKWNGTNLVIIEPPGHDQMVSKYSTTGSLVWTRRSKGLLCTAMGISLDGLGNVGLVGAIEGTNTFGSTVLSTHSTFGADSDAVLVKYDGAGNLLWARQAGGTNVDGLTAICMDAGGNSYSLGTYINATTIGATALTNSSEPYYVTKWNAQGNCAWVLPVPNLSTIVASSEDTLYVAHGSWLGKIGMVTAPIIISQPTNQTITPRANAVLRVAAAPGSVLTYQWYYGASGDTSRPIPYAQGDVCTAALNQTSLVWVRVSNPAGFADSLAVTITVETVPQIIGQPQSTVGVRGQMVTLSVTATGGGLSYQWYLGSDTTKPIDGATSDTFTTWPLTNNASFSVIVHNTQGGIASVVAMVTVDAPPQITVPPQNALVLRGQSVTLTVTATGSEPLSYQWYLGYDTTKPIAGAVSNSYTTGPLTNSSGFWVVVSNLGGTASAGGSVMVVDPVRITQQPQSVTITNGQSVTLRVSATGGQALVYQWFVGSSGDTNNPLPGQTLNYYTTPPLTATSRYWVLVSSVGSEMASQTAELTLLGTRATLGKPSCSGGKLNMQISGLPGSRWKIQSSANLITWQNVTDVATITLGTGGTTNLQTQLDASRAGFYRAAPAP